MTKDDVIVQAYMVERLPRLTKHTETHTRAGNSLKQNYLETGRVFREVSCTWPVPIVSQVSTLSDCWKQGTEETRLLVWHRADGLRSVYSPNKLLHLYMQGGAET